MEPDVVEVISMGEVIENVLEHMHIPICITDGVDTYDLLSVYEEGGIVYLDIQQREEDDGES